MTADVHPRELIRKAIVQRLIDADTDAADRVYPTREIPWRSIELPGIAVYSLEESSQRDHTEGPLIRHAVLAVHAVVRLNDGVDDALDGLALQVEQAIATDQTLGGIAYATFLAATEISVDESTSRPVGAVRLAFDVQYHTTSAVVRHPPTST